MLCMKKELLKKTLFQYILKELAKMMDGSLIMYFGKYD